MKTHRTITLTKEILAELRACASGRHQAAVYLPATLSTRPLANLRLAERVVAAREDYSEQGNSAGDIFWLLDKLQPGAGPDILSARGRYENNPPSPPAALRWAYDPYVLAQGLAMVADFLLQKQGK